jgi:hypothetical protein
MVGMFIVGCSSEEPKQSNIQGKPTNKPAMQTAQKSPEELKNSDIVVSNLSMTRNSVSAKVMGEAYNKSKFDCDGGTGKAILYDENGAILQTGTIMFTSIPAGGKAVITGSCQIKKDVNIAKYSIQIDGVIQK